MTDIFVSAVLPIYNEAGCVLQELERLCVSLKKLKKNFELVVVDDASVDGSTSLVEDFKKRNPDVSINLIKSKKNRGSGHSRRIGSIASRGEYVVWTDVDMTYPNDKVDELVRAIITSGADQVVGARTREMGTLRLLRTPAKYLIRKIAEFLVNQKIPDLNSGYRVFRSKIAEKYYARLPAGFSCVTTMTLSFLSEGYSVEYIPIDYQVRIGSSKFHPIRDTLKYIRQIVLLMMSYNPLRIFAVFFAISLLIGLLITTYSLANYHYIPSSAIIMFLLSVHFFSIGLLADLIIRVSKR